MCIARQASDEQRQNLFQIFGQGENEVLIASKARWDEQLTGLIREEVEHLSERQEVLADLMVEQEALAEESTRKVSREDLPGSKKLWRLYKGSTS